MSLRLTALSVAALSFAMGAHAEKTVLSGGNIIDVRTGNVMTGNSILVEDGRIVDGGGHPVALAVGDLAHGSAQDLAGAGLWETLHRDGQLERGHRADLIAHMGDQFGNDFLAAACRTRFEHDHGHRQLPLVGIGRPGQFPGLLLRSVVRENAPGPGMCFASFESGKRAVSLTNTTFRPPTTSLTYTKK